MKCRELLRSVGHDGNLFRPPYGRIKMAQLKAVNRELKTINWSVMPGDFDQHISTSTCFSNFTKNVKAGDIIVLHDSELSWKHLEYCLPRWLEFLKEKKMVSSQI